MRFDGYKIEHYYGHVDEGIKFIVPYFIGQNDWKINHGIMERYRYDKTGRGELVTYSEGRWHGVMVCFKRFS